MENLKRINTIIFILITISFLFSMSRSGNIEPQKTVVDQFGVDTGMTQEELNEFKIQYYNFSRKWDTQDYYTDRLYFLKTNLLKIDKFRNKYNIFLFSPTSDCNINDYIIRSELIVTGKYVGFQVDRDSNSIFPVTYKFKIDQTIANETEYDTIPEFISIKVFTYYSKNFDKFTESSSSFVNKGDQYLLFLERHAFHGFKKRIDEGKTKGYVSGDCFDPYVFSTLYQSSRVIKENRFQISSERSVFDSDNWMNINELHNTAAKILKINDKKNFYKRSYR